ncbi:MAG: extracellular solute-binding protein [Lachnospiraceae bacterium]|nr:extracellular solute-binding protein [Lachnospiraceae bacterium]
MRKRLLCIVLILMLVLTACEGESQKVRRGKTREADKKSSSVKKTPTPDKKQPTLTPTPTPEQGQVLRLWCTAVIDNSNRYAYEQAIRDMERIYPDIKLEWEANYNEDYKFKLKSALANPNNDTAPDIFYTWACHFLEDFVDAGTVYCLDDIYPKYASVLTQKMCKNVTFNGKLYGVPTNFSCVLVYANMSILKKVGYEDVPATFSELMECCDKLVAAGYTPFGLGAGYNQQWCTSEYLEPMIIQTIGAKEWEDILLERKTWNNSGIATAVDAFQEMMAKRYINADCNTMPNDDVKANFMKGKYAFYMNGSWCCADVINTLGATDEVKVCTFPVIDPGKGSTGYFIGGPSEALAVNARSKNAELAAEYVFELGRLISKYQYLTGCGLPTFAVDYEAMDVNKLTRQAAKLTTECKDMVLFGDVIMRTEGVEKYLRALEEVMNGTVNGTGFAAKLGNSIQ